MDRVILFDGVCNFCNSAVNFIIRHDPQAHLSFAALQSEPGRVLRTKFGVPTDVDSIVYVEGDHAYMYSAAALRISRQLGGVWSVAYALIIIPAPIRDFFYRLFARYRYTLFGQRDVCMIPTPDVRKRFLPL